MLDLRSLRQGMPKQTQIPTDNRSRVRQNAGCDETHPHSGECGYGIETACSRPQSPTGKSNLWNDTVADVALEFANHNNPIAVEWPPIKTC